MKSARKITGSLFLIAALLFTAVPHGFAATAKTPASGTAPVSAAPAKAPDPSANAVLSRILKSGAQLFYLGNQGGMDGWFILKDGQSQIAYTVPDGQHAVIGAMFMPDGSSVTVDQIEALLTAHPEIKTAMTNAARQSVDTQRAQVMTEDQQMATLNAGGLETPPSKISAEYANIMQMENAAAAAKQAGAPLKTGSPGEILYQDMVAAKSVAVGNNPSAPLIYMVIDPNCPHCQATWRMLRDSVFKNTLQVRLVPMGPENADGERAAAQLLHVANPLVAWNAYVEGDKTQLAGTPDPAAIHDVQGNHIMVDDWNLNQTPIIVYRGKDGKVKIVQGEPDKVNAMLDDVAAPTTTAP